MPEMFVRDEGEDVHAKCCTISFGDFLRMVTGRWQVHKAFWRRIWCLDQKKKKVWNFWIWKQQSFQPIVENYYYLLIKGKQSAINCWVWLTSCWEVTGINTSWTHGWSCSLQPSPFSKVRLHLYPSIIPGFSTEGCNLGFLDNFSG